MATLSTNLQNLINSARAVRGTSGGDFLRDSSQYTFDAAVLYGFGGNDAFVGGAGTDFFLGGEGESVWSNEILFYNDNGDYDGGATSPTHNPGVIIFAGGETVDWYGEYIDAYKSPVDIAGNFWDFYDDTTQAGSLGSALQYFYAGGLLNTPTLQGYGLTESDLASVDGFALDQSGNVDFFIDIANFFGTRGDDIFFGVEGAEYVGFNPMSGSDLVLGTATGWEKIHFQNYGFDDGTRSGVVVDAQLQSGAAYRELGNTWFANVDDFSGTSYSDLMIAKSAAAASDTDSYGSRLEGREGNDYLFGGAEWDDIIGGTGSDYIDFGDTGEGGRAQFDIVMSGTASASRIKIETKADYSGFEAFLDGKSLGSIGFSQAAKYSFNDVLGRLESNSQIRKANFDNTTVNNNLVNELTSGLTTTMATALTTAGDLNYYYNDTASQNDYADRDVIFNADEIALYIRDSSWNVVDRLVFNVDNLGQTLVPQRSEYIDSPVFYWTRWDDWRLTGTSGDDRLIFDDLKKFGGNGLDPDMEWGRIDPGAGNDYVDFSTSKNGGDIMSSKGADTIIGSEDWYDAIIFDGNSYSAVTVNVIDGTLVDEYGATDVIEDIDHFRMTAGNDVIYAADSTDATGMAGADIFYGSTGWTTVRYDHEHWDNPAPQGVTINFGPSNHYFYTVDEEGVQGYALESHTGLDTFGDLDTFLPGEFGEYFKNIRGSRYGDDILIGGTDYNELRGEGGNDIIVGGIGGGETSYGWSRPQDGLESSGIVANLTNFSISTASLSAASFNGNIQDKTKAGIDANTVIDNYGYIDAVSQINYLGATGFSDVLLVENLGVLDPRFGMNWSVVDPGAGNDLVIGGFDPNREYHRDDMAFNRVQYNSAEDFARWQMEWVNEQLIANGETPLPDPQGITIDLATARFDITWDKTTRFKAAVDSSPITATANWAGGVVDSAVLSAAEAYFDAYSNNAWNNGASTLQATGYLITDAFGDTDLIFNIGSFGGTSFADSLTGDAVDNELRGRKGNDSLYGEAGSDRLSGDEGDDLLVGGDGRDFMWGGDGADTFEVSGNSNLVQGTDTSTDNDNDFARGGAGKDVAVFVIANSDTAKAEDLVNADKSAFSNFFDVVNKDTGLLEVTRKDSLGSDKDVLIHINEIRLVNESGKLIETIALSQSVTGENGIILGGEGAEEFLATGSTRKITAGGGDDVIFVTGTNGSDNSQVLNLTLGAGADRIIVDRAFSGQIVISSASNDNELNIGNPGANYDRIDLDGRMIVDFDWVLNQSGGVNYYDSILTLDGGSTITFKKAVQEVVDPDTGEKSFINISGVDGIRMYEKLYDTSQEGYRDYEEIVVDDVFSTSDTKKLIADLNNRNEIDGWDQADQLRRDGVDHDGFVIFGLADDDLIYGSTKGDYLYGGVGRDYLAGEYGSDVLYGGAEGDLLSGGHGADLLFGGAGSDTYHVEAYFDSFLDYANGLEYLKDGRIKSSVDKISDLSGDNDRIFFDSDFERYNPNGFDGFPRIDVTLSEGKLKFSAQLDDSLKDRFILEPVASDFNFRSTPVSYFGSGFSVDWTTQGFTYDEEFDFDLYDIETYPGFKDLSSTDRTLLSAAFDSNPDTFLKNLSGVANKTITDTVVVNEYTALAGKLEFLNLDTGIGKGVVSAAAFVGATAGFEVDGFYEGVDSIEYMLLPSVEALSDPNMRLALKEYEADLIKKYSDAGELNRNAVLGEELLDFAVNNGMLSQYTLSATGIAASGSTENYLLVANKDRVNEHGVSTGDGRLSFLYVENSASGTHKEIGLIDVDEVVEVFVTPSGPDPYDTSKSTYSLSLEQGYVPPATMTSSGFNIKPGSVFADEIGTRGSIWIANSDLAELGLDLKTPDVIASGVSAAAIRAAGQLVLPFDTTAAIDETSYTLGDSEDDHVVVMGAEGDDILYGTDGSGLDGSGRMIKDFMVGNGGDDRFEGGAGENWMIGGAGSDKFIINNEAQQSQIFGDHVGASADGSTYGVNASNSNDIVYFDFDRSAAGVDLFEVSDGRFMLVYDKNLDTTPIPSIDGLESFWDYYEERVNTADDIVVELYNVEKLIFNDQTVSLKTPGVINLSEIFDRDVSYHNDNVSIRVDGDDIQIFATSTELVEVSRTFAYAEYTVPGAYYGFKGYDPLFNYDNWGVGSYRIVYDIEYAEVGGEPDLLWSGDRNFITKIEFADDSINVLNLDRKDINSGDYYTADKATGEIKITASGVKLDLSGNDIIFGTKGDDRIDGGDGDDIILGGDGDDYLIAGSGKNILLGGDGNDTIKADEGSLKGLISENIMIGGDGVDHITSNSKHDIVVTDRIDVNGDGAFNAADVAELKDVAPDNPLLDKLFEDDTWS